jgi:cyclopropane-fatty-acyl-phospholipid synthase
MVENFPASRITAVSNSNSQREYIQQQAKQRGLGNIDVMTCDVNQLTLDKHFERIIFL